MSNPSSNTTGQYYVCSSGQDFSSQNPSKTTLWLGTVYLLISCTLIVIVRITHLHTIQLSRCFPKTRRSMNIRVGVDFWALIMLVYVSQDQSYVIKSPSISRWKTLLRKFRQVGCYDASNFVNNRQLYNNSQQDCLQI